ncbi:phage protein NinX family protein [Pseudomonas sp. RW10S2]|uniref:phage protein NinX family protein n=1 Tax=Pseudomonas sp. RW10S2 TaxID=459637 RepID=UPI00164497B6|nr:phage protein NinX family protein [Pseudomonas sp. RW10S2]MBC3465046.1 DUF2591 family protein [Pseudomonas sp. RW10S2]
MTDLIEVRVSNLSGAALDWAVASALGWRMVRVPRDIDGNNGGEVLAPPDFSKDFHFPPRGAVPISYFLRRWSGDWSQGGQLIDEHRGSVHSYPGMVGDAAYSGGPEGAGIWCYGPTALVAFCRGFVRNKLGEFVQVPKELMP